MTEKSIIHPKNISINDYTYTLPDERIAKYPLPKRDESKLLIHKKGNISEDRYFNLANHLPQGSLLVFNNTKVVEARLLFTKSSGSTIEIFCLEPADIYHDITMAMSQKKWVMWKCLVGGAKKWKEEELTKIIETQNGTLELKASKAKAYPGYFLIKFSWSDDEMSFAEVLHQAGLIPLPPYIKRSAEETDKDRYQTVYAKYDGSVAAPTAGLHFTQSLFDKLVQKGIHKNFVTLHVGAGTFQPVKSETMQDHLMHAEFIDVSKFLIKEIMVHEKKKIIAVGTTSLRTIESLYWMGFKTIQNENISEDEIMVSQWDPYETTTTLPSRNEALQSLLKWMDAHHLDKLITKTQIIIAPGYSLKVADALITNFHQPQSTLLLLVASIIGTDWKKVYDYALDNDFRFLSYGDGSLLWYNP